MNDPIFAINPVCRLRKQLARGLLAQDILLATVRRELVGRIGLPIAKLPWKSANSNNVAKTVWTNLFDADGERNFGYSIFQIRR